MGTKEQIYNGDLPLHGDIQDVRILFDIGCQRVQGSRLAIGYCTFAWSLRSLPCLSGHRYCTMPAESCLLRLSPVGLDHAPLRA